VPGNDEGRVVVVEVADTVVLDVEVDPAGGVVDVVLTEPSANSRSSK
jgi:hypothetical protein